MLKESRRLSEPMGEMERVPTSPPLASSRSEIRAGEATALPRSGRQNDEEAHPFAGGGAGGADEN